MAHHIRRVSYFYTTVEHEPGEACELLTTLAQLGVNLLALNLVPIGPSSTQLTLFPEDDRTLVNAADKARISLMGPHPALLVQGDDEMGALAGVHTRLHDAKVQVFASSAVTDGKGYYGYVVYVKPNEFDRAIQALEL